MVRFMKVMVVVIEVVTSLGKTVDTVVADMLVRCGKSIKTREKKETPSGKTGIHAERESGK